MTEPIKSGDRAEVIDGYYGKDSPNIGLIVKVGTCQGEHSKFGRIGRCQAEYAERGQQGLNVPDGWADFAQSWLRKLPPGAVPPKAAVRETERTE